MVESQEEMEDVKAKNASSVRTGTMSWSPSSENSAGHEAGHSVVFVGVIECALGEIYCSGVAWKCTREGKAS